ncbi:MAG: hypothetical protein ACLQVI_43830 [Polyangiaceae bacterium]|jgi:hypothetical protein
MTSLSTPTAIVVGFGLLGTLTGLGLYFGLRSRPVALVDSTQTAAAIASVTSRAGAPVVGAAPAATAATTAGTAAADAARHAIEAQHAHLVETCWNPSFAKRAEPPHVAFKLTLDYVEDGRLQVHSFQQEPGGARADVTMCVDKELVMPVVPPPGRRVRLIVPITLP